MEGKKKDDKDKERKSTKSDKGQAQSEKADNKSKDKDKDKGIGSVVLICTLPEMHMLTPLSLPTTVWVTDQEKIKGVSF